MLWAMLHRNAISSLLAKSRVTDTKRALQSMYFCFFGGSFCPPRTWSSWTSETDCSRLRIPKKRQMFGWAQETDAFNLRLNSSTALFVRAKSASTRLNTFHSSMSNCGLPRWLARLSRICRYLQSSRWSVQLQPADSPALSRTRGRRAPVARRPTLGAVWRLDWKPHPKHTIPVDPMSELCASTTTRDRAIVQLSYSGAVAEWVNPNVVIGG